MNNNQVSTGYERRAAAPAAFHIRRRRQWYGARRLTQQELAELSGVTQRQVRRLEGITRFPRAVAALVRLAVALDVSVEALLDPRHVRRIQRDVEARRRQWHRAQRDAT